MSITAAKGGVTATSAGSGAAAKAAAKKGFLSTVTGKIIAAVLAAAVVGGISGVIALGGSGGRDEDRESGKQRGEKEGVSNTQGVAGDEAVTDDGLVDYWLITEVHGGEVEYDENYNVTRYFDGYWYRSFAYNDQNLPETMTITRQDGGLDTLVTYYYDGQGNIIREDETFEDPTAAEYNEYAFENGKRIKKTWFNTYGEIQKWVTEEYDAQGRLIKIHQYWNNVDQYESHYTFTYNEDGQVVSRICHDEDGNLIGQLFNYYEDGRLVRQEATREPVFYYEYDEHGNLITIYTMENGRRMSEINFGYTKVRITREQAERLDESWGIVCNDFEYLPISFQY